MENKIDKPDESPNLLKQFTAARVALGRTGSSVPLRESLAFKLAHAYARDAVYSKLNNGQLLNDLLLFNLPVLQVHSRAKDRGINICSGLTWDGCRTNKLRKYWRFIAIKQI